MFCRNFLPFQIKTHQFAGLHSFKASQHLCTQTTCCNDLRLFTLKQFKFALDRDINNPSEIMNSHSSSAKEGETGVKKKKHLSINSVSGWLMQLLSL